MWLLAGLWHLVIVPGFYAHRAGASHHEGGSLIVIAYVVLAAIMVAMCNKAKVAGSAWLVGLTIGLLVGLLWVTPHAIVRAVVHSHDQGVDYIGGGRFRC